MKNNPLLHRFRRRNHIEAKWKDLEFIENIPNFLDTENLGREEIVSLDWYRDNAKDYDDYLPLTFQILGCDEFAERKKMYTALDLSPGMRVLEIGCGTGRDSIFLADCLEGAGELFLQDISLEILTIAKTKFGELPNRQVDTQFFLSSASNLPFEDDYFDRIFHFGGLNTFSNLSETLQEIVRVAKPGAKILLGDEGFPLWLRETEFYKAMSATNFHYSHVPPTEFLPDTVRNVRLEWFMGEAFYFMLFDKATKVQNFNLDIEIPGIRGGTPRKRLEGVLEGISPDLKERAYKEAAESGLSRVEWLEQAILKKIEDSQ
jgi:ubiquinone/menaquinone biosynthesis C-methylase UbiE